MEYVCKQTPSSVSSDKREIWGSTSNIQNLFKFDMQADKKMDFLFMRKQLGVTVDITELCTIQNVVE